MSDKAPEVILLKEPLLQSLLIDVGTLALFVSLIGIGVFLQSSAMQWIGAIIGFLIIINRAAQKGKANRMTIPQARAKLDQIEAASKAKD